MEHTLTVSSDGSSTLKLTHADETYHSATGAFSEALHIYIRNGLERLLLPPDKSPSRIYIYDIGLGTALNCLLSWWWQQEQSGRAEVYYHGIEKYPIGEAEAAQLNFPQHLAAYLEQPEQTARFTDIFRKMHQAPWGCETELSPGFLLLKTKVDLRTFSPLPTEFPCVIFYDTFSPATQPELWDAEIFRRFAQILPPGSLLVTYSAKGTVKQALREAGFTVKRLPGANGKHHMVLASINY